MAEMQEAGGRWGNAATVGGRVAYFVLRGHGGFLVGDDGTRLNQKKWRALTVLTYLNTAPERGCASEASRSAAELQCATIYWMRRAMLPLLRLVEDDTVALRHMSEAGNVQRSTLNVQVGRGLPCVGVGS